MNLMDLMNLMNLASTCLYPLTCPVLSCPDLTTTNNYIQFIHMKIHTNMNIQVPMLDFINCVEGPDPSRVHSTQVRHVTGIPSSKKKEKPSQAVTSASWTFGEGAQVFENYGQANYIYFMYHGFGLPVGKNSHDCVNWRISFSPQERKAMQVSLGLVSV